ncbi:DUF4352 domain-containing protein [Desulfosporosinus hippei]|uniref:DUF4352 domain-containing protein n=1 Tax=Desulfosporosinus hippei DSM 8344 TaxID=1121419 RepID=A0A1G7W8M6_9FIRM|nr:DUF4352 domain-containing protein [Desulfosporosinus hippei]SDG68293.1 protein of unknown function [Desulfosporosinus hippei DSM 8344]
MGKLVVVGKAGKQRRYCSQAQYCLLVLLVPMVIFLLGAGALTTQAHTNSSRFLTSQASLLTLQEEYMIGETFKIGNLQYRINSIRTSDGSSEVKSPSSGNVFLFINLTIENQSPSDVEVRSTIGFKLKDLNGNSHESSLGAFLAAKSRIDGTIRSKEAITGELGYEVSEKAKMFNLIVVPDPFNSKAKNASVRFSIDR